MSATRVMVRLGIVGGVAAVIAAGALAPLGAGASTPRHGTVARATVGTHYALTQQACRTATVGRSSCGAERLVRTTKGTPGARPYAVTAGYPVGPVGGYTPGDLASAYGFNPDAAVGATQVVGIVDAYNDPNARADLDHFDENYGMPDETASSLRIVGQTGSATALPGNDTSGWSVEESLDLDAVRGVCHQCEILLVEANSNSNNDLRAGVAAAAALGATEISNSYGADENPTESASAAAADYAAYDYPGIVVTASTGDHGWYDFDYMNEGYPTNGTPEEPASLPDVVSVGGTSLDLNANGTRADETVWNHDGVDDAYGWDDEYAEGASGGGCSSLQSASAWQSAVAGFSATGCGSKRSSADISAIADPYTGYDIYDSFSYSTSPAYDWATFGGTSLASPVIAAMYALAGGTKAGESYPATSLYGNFAATPSSLYDVTSGGNSYCGGDTPAHCASAGPLHSVTGGSVNPNGTGYRTVDCSFAAWPSTVGTINPNDTQCNAAVGYDGPSGVGSPDGLSVFSPITPGARITGKPASVALGKPASFAGAGSGDGIPGESIASYAWSWGDGSAASSGASPSHTFMKAGTYTVTLTVLDNFSSYATASATITVGEKPTVKASGPTSLKVKKKGTFKAKGSDANTGGSISKYKWKFGDGSTADGAKVKHAFKEAGTYHVSVTATDNTGLKTKKKLKVKVKK